ncbi:MAG: N-acetyltransferase [Proteobacteria bacterium]|nr:N-acetyltransferase [Pseudomonadota bacterium]
MKIRKAVESDTSEILNVHKKAFGEQKGIVIRQLVDSLFEDITAKPIFSLVAVEDDTIVGHILFTKVIINGASEGLPAQILAPLAVLPNYQNRGGGCQLVKAGIEELRKSGVKLLFVLGHPGYYPRYGFSPAGELGYEAPYPIPEEHSGAWMVQELYPGIIGVEKGAVQCSDALNEPEHWRE